MAKLYPRGLWERAVRVVGEVWPNDESDWAAIAAVAAKLSGGTAKTLREWVRQVQFEAGPWSETMSGESAELKRLRRENVELHRANEVLNAASAVPTSVGLLRPGLRPWVSES